jgi:PAS domain S-box-containing protein
MADLNESSKQLAQLQVELDMRNHQLQQMQRELTQARHYFESAPVGFLALDRHGIILDCNRSAAELLGLERSCLLDRPLQALFEPQMSRTLLTHLDQVFASGRHTLSEMRIVAQTDGRVSVLSIDSSLYLPSDGEQCCFSTLLDITGQVCARQAYQAKEQRYRLLLNSLDELVSVYDVNGICRFMNRRIATLLGGRPEHLVGRSLHELFPDAAAAYIEHIHDVIRTGENKEYEEEVLFPAGSRRLSARLRPIQDEKGTTIAALIICQDVTEHRSAERAMRRNEERLKALINATTDDVVVLLDSELNMEIVNERAARGFGRTMQQLTGRPIGEFMPPAIAKTRREYALKVLSGGCTYRFEDQRAGHWFDNNMCPVFDDEGKPQAVAIFARDITQRKKMEQALAEAKESAEKANLAKSRFLAAANHDLRQPLQAMRLLLESLTLYQLEPRAAEVVEDMKEAMQFMEGLLSALLDISKLEAGSVVPKKKHFHVVPFLHRLRGQFRATAQDAGKQIHVFTSNAVLYTDPMLLARILQNFLTNAIRHAAGERILVACRFAKGHRRIEVWDDGPGIPADQLDKIFEEFYQIGNPARNLNQGLGLGLAITRRIAKLLELPVTVKSRPGQGSIFAVEVPLGTENQPIVTEHTGVSFNADVTTGLILVVDDDPIVLNATETLLEALHYEAVCAESVEDAIELVRQYGAKIRMALLDYRLPGEWDGIQLLKIIRDILQRNLPAVLVSGDTSIDRLKQVRLSGLPLLHKPIELAVLRRHLEDAMSRKVIEGDIDPGDVD